MQTIVHYSLHLLAPAFVAWLFFRDNWKRVYLVFLLTLFIDLDHLVATPIFDPERCSIGFHFLHTWYAITIYLLMLFFKKTRIIAIGLLMHIVTDVIDCVWIFGGCLECYKSSGFFQFFR